MGDGINQTNGRRLAFNKTQIICLFIVFAVILAYAWMCDDAYHAHRMSWNLIHGNGFVYNVGERVSATTAPLWTLITTLLIAVTGSAYWSSMVLSFACSMSAIYIMERRFGQNNFFLYATTCLLIFCNSFITYSTSGLENPMLFLLASFVIIIFLEHENFDRKKLLLLSFVSSLLITTRMDIALLFLPLLVYAFFIKSENKLQAILCGLLGMSPFIIWELFSILYYGFPFPNTMYAKLNTGFPFTDYLKRGIRYFFYSLFFDPLLLVVPVIYILYSLWSKNKKHILISLGIVLYYAYITYIGGDFMQGRHYTVPFFVSIFCAFDLIMPIIRNPAKRKESILLKSVFFILAICVSFQVLIINGDFWNRPNFSDCGISDERRAYFWATSIFKRYISAKKLGISRSEFETTRWKNETNIIKRVISSGKKGDIIPFAPGIALYYVGQNIYLSDNIALGDPLLSHLPAIHDPKWIIGHMRREIPEGYRESIQSGENKIVDPSLREYYDVLCMITRSRDLFAIKRLKAIIKMNLGGYKHLIEEYVSRKDNPHFYYNNDSPDKNIAAYNNIVSLTDNKGRIDFAALFDGSYATIWNTGKPMRAGDFLVFEFVSPVRYNYLHLDIGFSPNDYPRDLQIFTSYDGEKWVNVKILGNDTEKYLFDTEDYRFLCLLNNKNDNAFWWSIYEMRFGIVDPQSVLE